MTRLWSIITTLLFCSLQIGASVQGDAHYRAKILERMALALDKTVKTPNTADSIANNIICYNGKVVRLVAKDGCIDHIGYAIFSDAQRNLIGDNVCNFVERLALLADLPLKEERTMAQFVKEENIIFKKGNLSTLKTISPELFMQIDYELLRERLHHIKWTDKGQVVCDIAFPADHELLTGMNLMESESRIVAGVKATKIASVPSQFFYPEELVRRKGHNYWVKPGTKYLIDAVSSDRYYTCINDTTYKPVHDAHYQVESIFNALTDCDMESHIEVKVKLKKYPLTHEWFKSDMAKIVQFCINEGCVGFVGLSDTEGEDTVGCLLIMRNIAMGYNHVIRIKVHITDFQTMTGTAEARWNAYVPSSNIKDLFYHNENGLEWKK